MRPKRDEFAIARALRAASPTASPNARLVALADDALGRRGRMNEAIAEIGRGQECSEGEPFTLGAELTVLKGASVLHRLRHGLLLGLAGRAEESRVIVLAAKRAVGVLGAGVEKHDELVLTAL